MCSMATYALDTVFYASGRLEARRKKLRFQYRSRTNAQFTTGRVTIIDDPAPGIRKWLRKNATGEYISFFSTPFEFNVHLEKEKDALAFRLCFSGFK